MYVRASISLPFCRLASYLVSSTVRQDERVRRVRQGPRNRCETGGDGSNGLSVPRPREKARR